MRRYALFTYDWYYPGGGWSDFVNTFDSIEEGVTAATNPRERDCIQIIDLTNGEDVTPSGL